MKEFIVNSHHLFFVPYWTEETLKRQGLSLQSITDYPSLAKALSQEQLVELLLFQSMDLIHAKTSQLTSDTLCDGALYQSWCESSNQCPTLVNLIKLAKHYSDNAEYLLAMRQKLSMEPSFQLEDPSPYRVIDMQGKHLVMVIAPGYDRVDMLSFYQLIRQVIELYYMYVDKQKVVTRPIFRLYVDLMMRARALS